MSTESPTSHVCSGCGRELPVGVPSSRCPACLLRLSVLTDGTDDGTSRRASQPWTVLGDCELYEEIGRGGMGVVYHGRQRRLARDVAVKVLLGAPFATPEERLRFGREAEAAARLRHPGIVVIHDIGEDRGTPWFSMERLSGPGLDGMVRTQPLEARPAAVLVEKIARAVAHAHDQGVLHRDLKPSNVLLGYDGEPRVTDFGIALLTGVATAGGGTGAPSTLTRTGQALGSPGYAAPELVLGGKADERTDVYGLGAVLYHLLTGRPPFQGPSIDAIVLQLRESDPLSPRRLNPAVPRDLETICLKCLRREPNDRYPEAEAVSAELQRWLEGRPILARPTGLVAKAFRWMRRHPANAALLLLLAAGTVAAFALVDGARRREAGAREVAQAARHDSEARSRDLETANRRIGEVLDATELERAEEWISSQQRDLGIAAMAKVARRTPGHPSAGPRLASALFHGGAALPLLPCYFESRKIHFLDTLRSGGILIGTEGGAVVRDPATGSAVRHFHAEGATRGRYIRDGSEAVLAAVGAEKSVAYFWDMGGEPRRPQVVELPEPLADGALSPDGGLFLGAFGAGGVRWYHTDTGERLTGPPGAEAALASACAFRPDGREVAVGGRDMLEIRDAATREVTARLSSGGATWSRLAYSRDGHFLAAGGEGGEVALYVPESGSGLPRWTVRHSGPVTALEFSPRANRLLSASVDHTARIWNTADGTARSAPMTHRAEVLSARFDSDATQFVVTTSADNTARLWHAHTGQPLSLPLQHAEQVKAAAFSADRSTVLTGGADGVIQRWGLDSCAKGPRLLTHGNAVTHAEWSADGRHVLTVSKNGESAVWETDGWTKTMIRRHGEGPAFAAFRPQSQGVMLPRREGGASLAGLDGSGEKARDFAVDAAAPQALGAFDAVGGRYACMGPDGTVWAWEVDSGRVLFGPLSPERGHLVPIAVAFSPDGLRLLTVAASDVNEEDDATLRDASTGAVVAALRGHTDDILSACFSPDGRWIATAGNDNVARLWHAATGEPAAGPLPHRRGVEKVAFSPDSRLLATASLDRTARIWDVVSGQPVTVPLQHGGEVECVAFSPEGRRLATGSRDRAVRFWEPTTGLPAAEALWHDQGIAEVAFSPDGRQMLVCGQENAAFVWQVPPFDVRPPAWLVDLAAILAQPDLNRDPASILDLLVRYRSDMERLRAEPAESLFRPLADRLLGPLRP